MNQPANDAIIIGAGIIGCAIADALSREGLRVTVVESRSPGSGTTAAAMGHLVVMDDSEAQFNLTRYSVELWRQQDLPKGVEFDRSRTLWVATDDLELAEVQRKAAFYRQRGVEVQVLDGRQIAESEPNLRPGLAGGLRITGDSMVYPPAAAKCLLDRAIARGSRLVPGQARVIFPGRVMLTSGTEIDAPIIVNAAGFASPQLTPGISVNPRKGHLLITERYPGFIHHQIIELGYLKSAHGAAADSVAFNLHPRTTGQIIIGSSRQYGSTDPAIDHGILSRMLLRAFEYMPALANLTAIRAWAGFRPATPDKLPLIGPMPGMEGVYLATGHEGLGITTSLATAELIAAHIFHRTPPIPAEPYLPGRLAKEAPRA